MAKPTKNGITLKTKNGTTPGDESSKSKDKTWYERAIVDDNPSPPSGGASAGAKGILKHASELTDPSKKKHRVLEETEARNRQWLIEHGEDPDDPIFN
jgi:hypothetical protein|tara:strand:- start:27 stop:320 length:294 start_codon:yes stop_codon:yes gene_type:complete